MGKQLHAEGFDGGTFGMVIEAGDTYRKFKQHIKEEKVIGYYGDEFKVLTVPAEWLGAIMGDAHWLVTEIKSFNKVQIEGLYDYEAIFVKYDDDVINFRTRRQKYHRRKEG